MLVAIALIAVLAFAIARCTGSPVPPLAYDLDDIQTHGQVKTYTASNGQTSKFGIDVSYHNGTIDWPQVAAQGVQFAYVRAGWRGYTVGEVQEDPMARYNISYAKGAGIDVGLYFFSQAITEAEACEEADFVCDMADAYELRGFPVVFDMEENNIEDERIAQLSDEERTQIAVTFCERVRERGYEPMVYSNVAWFASHYDLVELTKVAELWLAEYKALPSVSYNFRMWQYSSEGHLEGIDTNVDLNILFPAS